jgi:hypothetical protein
MKECFGYRNGREGLYLIRRIVASVSEEPAATIFYPEDPGSRIVRNVGNHMRGAVPSFRSRVGAIKNMLQIVAN